MQPARQTPAFSRETATRLLDNIEEAALAFNLASLAPRIRACRAALEQEGVVNVAVVGRFKAGKSSLLNRLAGRDLLPVDVLPATAVVTRLYHGSSDRLTVRYAGGLAEDVPLDRLAEFATEQGNPHNAKRVAVLEVELAALDAYTGIHFVDSPGLGSVYAHNTKTSMDWLPEIGVALVAVSVDHPLSADDLDLLHELGSHTPQVVVVLTKVDLVEEEQAARVAGFIRSEIEQRLGREIAVLPFSNHTAYSAHARSLQSYLLDHVAHDHDDRFVEVLDHKLSALQTACRTYLNLALTAAEADEEAVARLQALLRRKRGDLGLLHNQLRVVTRDLTARARTDALERFRALAPAVEPQLRAQFDEQSPTWSGNLSTVTGAFQDWISDALLGALRGVEHQGGVLQQEHTAAAKVVLTRIVRAFRDRLSDDVERALGVAFPGTDSTVEIAEPPYPDIRVDRAFDIPLDLLWFVIPMRIFRGAVLRHMRRQIPWETEKNLTRLAMQWAEAVSACLADAAREAQAFVDLELQTVEGLVAGRDGRSTRIRQALNTIGAEPGPAQTPERSAEKGAKP